MGVDATAGVTALVGLDGFVVLAWELVEGDWWILVETTADVVGCDGCGTRAVGHGRRTVTVREPGVRGEITDRNGVVLARNRRNYEVSFNLEEIYQAWRANYREQPKHEVLVEVPLPGAETAEEVDRCGETIAAVEAVAKAMRAK